MGQRILTIADKKKERKRAANILTEKYAVIAWVQKKQECGAAGGIQRSEQRHNS